MLFPELTEGRSASPYFSFFQAAFEAADIASSFWQPWLKTVGRSQLEMASLAARQGQALFRWQRSVIAAKQPGTLIEANIQLFQEMSAEYAAFAPRMAAAVTHASRGLPAMEVVPLPQRKSRDQIIIPPAAEQDEDTVLERRVA